MKFCKNLQRVIVLSNKSNPEWSPFWVNYKALKKLILKLPSLVPVTESYEIISDITTEYEECSSSSRCGSCSTNNSSRNSSNYHDLSPDDEGEIILQIKPSNGNNSNAKKFGYVHIKDGKEQELIEAASNSSKGSTASLEDDMVIKQKKRKIGDLSPSTVLVQALSKRPGEIAFFQLLHSELKKAKHFFDGVQVELEIREQRIRDGMVIITKQQQTSPHQWSYLAHSLVNLNKDLLMLETYAIMSFCSFSKILKKHDKVTGFNTREAFMEHEVKKANFADYPQVLNMIQRCEKLFEEIWEHAIEERQQEDDTQDSTSSSAAELGLFEDERLFIYFVHQLNDQAMGTAEDEGAVIRSRHSSFRNSKKKLKILQSTSLSPLPPLSSPSTDKCMASRNTNTATNSKETGIPSIPEKSASAPLSSSIAHGTLTSYLRSIVEQYGAKVQETASSSQGNNSSGDYDEKLPSSTPVPFS